MASKDRSTFSPDGLDSSEVGYAISALPFENSVPQRSTIRYSFVKLKIILSSILCTFSVQGMAAERVETSAYETDENKKRKTEQSIPLVPFSVGDAGTLSVSDTAAGYVRQSDDNVVKINAGIYDGGRAVAVTGIDAATMLGDHTALGMNLMLSVDKSEAALSGVSHFKDSGLRVRGTLSYMQGNKQFDFYRSSERAKLSQVGYYVSISGVNNGLSDLGLQSLGLSVWGAKAKNHSMFDTQRYVDQTANYILLTTDQRRLAEGLLRGASIDLQYAPYANLVLKGALGMEQIKFPLSNGSEEK